MPKRKNFNRRALSCTSKRTHLEGRRSVELMDLPLKPVRASRVLGFQGPYGGYQLVLTLYRTYIFCFQMCNRLPELMKSGDARIFHVYYILRMSKHILSVLQSVDNEKGYRALFSTLLSFNASCHQSTHQGSPTRTFNVPNRHPHGQVGTGLIRVKLSVVAALLLS